MTIINQYQELAGTLYGLSNTSSVNFQDANLILTAFNQDINNFLILIMIA